MIKLPPPPEIFTVRQYQNWIARLWERVTQDLGNNDWADWTPSMSNDESMTISDDTVNSAQYATFGNVVFFAMDVSFTTGGSADNSVFVTLPSGSSNAMSVSGLVVDGSSEIAGFGFVAAGSSTLEVRRYDSANFGLGSGRRISLSGCYKSAITY